MAEHILKCPTEHRYTMEKKCPSCGSDTLTPRPPKFSLNDKYSSLRREVKKKELIEKGLY
ncbi:MAG: RNA-protein complex protein Nop10 [Nanoarchaeota archaeon]|nr:RNA-protein complex protein Nop10 [Nanoarchaeota archaeon]MBU1631728.1 RNA-protein complex protein Nop10 [Nanoarchaeota archaeon]MBU1875871.1 RNA-protein complex protein Nop10 [Nanoarchaeota archaeon]